MLPLRPNPRRMRSVGLPCDALRKLSWKVHVDPAVIQIPRTSCLDFRKLAVALGLAVAALLYPARALSHSGSTYTVEMTAGGFVPSQLEVIAGDTVIFENTDQEDHWPASDLHPTHERYSDFDSQRPIPAGQAWSFTFFRPGNWRYHDHLNPRAPTGQIVVLADTHAVGQNQGDAEVPAAGRPTGLARIWAAIKTYVSSVFEAARQLMTEVFGPQVAAAPATPQPELFGQPELDTEFRPPPQASFDQVYRDLQPNCAADDFECWVSFFRQQAISFGPQISVDLVLQLKRDGNVAPSVDEHQLGHQIGRQTAESFGINDQAFLLCPMSQLNGGCQHGFFEFVLGRADSTSAAADLICRALEDGYSAKDYFYCYHGVGHGVMMAAAYDLDRALEVCDSFETLVAQDGCWQGVFMENTNAGMGGYARQGVFSLDNPLAPCDSVAERHKHECYVNHAGWLMDFFDNDLAAASAACASVTDGFERSCLESLGLMVTNPVWQIPLYGDTGQASFEQIAWELCRKFPSGYRDSCVIGGIDNIHNFDQFDLDRAEAFCNAVGAEFQMICYERMGLNLYNQATAIEEVLVTCGLLDEKFQSACLTGAGVES